MKTAKFISLCLLILAGAVFVLGAEPSRTDINPALLYYQAFLLVPDPMSNADEEYLGSKAGLEQKLPERYGNIFAGYNNQFKLLRNAAQQKAPCDWGIDMSSGPSTLLPHLARAKAVAQASQLRVMWSLQHGNQTGARDDLLAAFVLARNISRDGTVIGALVQNASEVLEFSTVAQNFGQFSPETLRQLVEGSDAAPAQGTMADTMVTEKLNGPDFWESKIQKLQKEYLGNDFKVMEGIRGYVENNGLEYYANREGEPDTNLWQKIEIASGGTSDGVLKLLHEMEPLYPRLAEILSLPQKEYEGRMAKFAAEIRKSQNPLLPVLFPNPLAIRVREYRVQAQLAMVHAAVEYELHGESGLKSVTDPFGNGGFGFQRFVFEGVERGFELKSAYAGLGYPCVMIFVEKQGPAFQIMGPNAGKPITQ